MKTPYWPKGRTGKECHKVDCEHFKAYSNWSNNLGSSHLKFCVECRNAHVSQFRRAAALSKAEGETQNES